MEHGLLIHRRNSSWACSYESGDDDEPILRLTISEYVSLTEHVGVARPFRVVDISRVLIST